MTKLSKLSNEFGARARDNGGRHYEALVCAQRWIFNFLDLSQLRTVERYCGEVRRIVDFMVKEQLLCLRCVWDEF